MSRNYKKFLMLWMGECISSIGGGLTSFGLGVYVFEQTHSAASMALVTLLAFLPTLILSVPAGVLADKYDRRLLMILGDGCSAVGLIYILINLWRGSAGIGTICLGVFVSAVFSALLEPSYRATISDLLSEEEYSKAGGMVSLAGSARYLISPVLAGVLLSVGSVELLLCLDIMTFVLTVITTALVRRGLDSGKKEAREPMQAALREGWRAVTADRGVFMLILVSSLITCFMGVLQILAEPLVLDFADSTTLGITETICAGGMLVSSVFLGIRGIKRYYVRALCFSVMGAGAAMAAFGCWEQLVWICGTGFLFFAMLPFANNSLDYLVRINIDKELQGRAWGFIGFISQMGYVIAYGFAGIAADCIAVSRQLSVGRGAGRVIVIAGILLVITGLILYRMKAVRQLEEKVTLEE